MTRERLRLAEDWVARFIEGAFACANDVGKGVVETVSLEKFSKADRTCASSTMTLIHTRRLQNFCSPDLESFTSPRLQQ